MRISDWSSDVCSSDLREGFWRDNGDPASIPDRLKQLLEEWRYRPPSRFDFILDLESFAPFNYQYILYGMEFRTDLSPVREDFPDIAEAERIFARIKIGSAHVCTPVTNAPLVCRALLEQKTTITNTR